MAKIYDKIMLIDTAAAACSVCVTHGDTITMSSEDMTHGQAERLIPMIDETLGKANLAYDDITAIVTTMGPGGFTGVRVALSSAKAMASALNIKLYGISSFQAFAITAKPHIDHDFYTILDSRRDDFYRQLFSEEARPLNAPEIISAKDIDVSQAVFYGDAFERLQDTKSTNISGTQITAPDLRAVAAFIQSEGDNIADILIENPDALYMRPADVSKPKKKKRVLASS